MIKITLQKDNGETGYVYRETDEGLQVGMMDSLTRCKIIEIEEEKEEICNVPNFWTTMNGQGDVRTG